MENTQQQQPPNHNNSSSSSSTTSRPMLLLTFNPSIGMPDLLPSLEQRFTVLRLYDAPDLALHSLSIHVVVGSRASSQLIDSLPNLRLICCQGVGVDKVDLAKCREKGITVTNSPGASSDDVADLAILLMLAVSRRLCSADRYVRQGLWPVRGPFMLANKASGRRIGIVGLGRIGLAIAKRAEGFGCTISYQGKAPKPDVPYFYHPSLIDLATNSDIIIVSCPLTSETRHTINGKVLDALGPQGTLVNIARGPIVDEVELVKALKEGRIGAAALDVFENEPNVSEELFNMDNVVLTPHFGSATRDSRRAMGDLIIANLEAFFAGKPLLTPVEF